MRVVVFTLISLMVSIGYTCDQATYDQVYRGIIVDSIKDNSPDVFTIRNERIHALRRLCNGQRSSYERVIDGRIRGVVRGSHK